MGLWQRGETLMTVPITFQTSSMAPAAVAKSPAAVRPVAAGVVPTGKAESSDIGKRFEQMLWTEMLTYAGLDKAFSQGGGEAAASFSRYVVESIAQDLAEKHPRGLGEKVDQSMAARQSQQLGDPI